MTDIKRKVFAIIIRIAKMLYGGTKTVFRKIRTFLEGNRIFFELGFTFLLVLFTCLLFLVTRDYTSFTRNIVEIQQEQIAVATTRGDQILVQIEPSFMAGTKIKKDAHLTLLFRNLSPVLDFTVTQLYITADVYRKAALIEKEIILVDMKIDKELPRGIADRLNVIGQLTRNLKGKQIIDDKEDLADKCLRNLTCQIYYVSKLTGTPYVSSKIEFEAK
jgi:hypothetical protein